MKGQNPVGKFDKKALQRKMFKPGKGKLNRTMNAGFPKRKRKKMMMGY